MDDFDTRVSAYAVIVEDDRLLLAHFVGADGPAWTLPGGGVEMGEAIDRCRPLDSVV